MPRTTRADAYGPEYEQMILLAMAAEEEKAFHFASVSLARSIKSKVYAYWRALRSEGLRPDLIEKVNLLSLRVDGSCLVIFRREDAWDAKLLRESMGLEKGFAEVLTPGILVARSPVEVMQERLAELRAAEQKKK